MPLAPHWGILSNGSTQATPLVSHWGQAALSLNYVPSSCPTAFDDLSEGVRVLLEDRMVFHGMHSPGQPISHGLFSSSANNAEVGKISLRLECGTFKGFFTPRAQLAGLRQLYQLLGVFRSWSLTGSSDASSSLRPPALIRRSSLIFSLLNMVSKGLAGHAEVWPGAASSQADNSSLISSLKMFHPSCYRPG